VKLEPTDVEFWVISEGKEPEPELEPEPPRYQPPTHRSSWAWSLLAAVAIIALAHLTGHGR